MAKKLSYVQYLTSSPRKRGIYFWARRGISLLLAVVLYGILKPFIGQVFALILSITALIGLYMYVSHYLALAVMALEDMLSGGRV